MGRDASATSAGLPIQATARVILGVIEMIHMMGKQAKYAYNPQPLLAEEFNVLAA